MSNIPGVLALDNVLTSLSTQLSVTYAILCAKAVYTNTRWSTWADNWLSNKDRTSESAAAAIGFCDTTVYGSQSQTVLEVQAATIAAINAAGAACSLASGDSVTRITNAVDNAVNEADFAQEDVVWQILATHFTCPHCHQPHNQHLASGKCLFGPYLWEDFIKCA